MAARVGLLEMDLALPGVRSLKEKRRIISSLKDRIRERFNVSVAEVEYCDEHRRSLIAVAAVANDGGYVNGLLDRVLGLARAEHRVSLVDYGIEVM